MPTTIVTRAGKGSALTHAEVDANFTNLQATADAAQVAGATLASLEGLSLVSGDILYATAADTLARLPKGTDGQYLRLDGGFPDWETLAGGGDALTTNPLSQFAATTSLELKGVISDETGSGALVFANTPTLVTPILGTPTSGTLTNCTIPVAGLSDATANGRSLISSTNYASMRGLLDLEAGTDFYSIAAADAAFAAIGRTLTAGAGLTGGGTLSADRTFTVGAGTGIVANTDDVAVDKATDANVRASASNKVLTTDLVESASAFVALTSTSNSIAIDWDSGINFSHTFTENTVFANPTNGQPGTWRTIRTTQHASAPKTIGVGTQYHSLAGAAVSTTATNSAVDHYTIMCITSSLFVIFQSLNIADVP